MSTSRRLARGITAVGLAAALAAGASACGAPEDETATPSKAAPTAPVTPTTTSGAFVMPDGTVPEQLDPETKAKCDAVWSFQLFSYTAHTLPTREAAEVARLKAGLKENEQKVASSVPDLAAPVKALSEHAQTVLQGDPKPGTTLTGDLADDNAKLLGFLRTTCKMTG